MSEKEFGMNESIKVSIVIPIYNVAPYIADCLRSVYEQTYPNLEVILVNDDTPDDSMEQAAPWIEKLREKYEVKVANHTDNKGLSAARNTGIKVSATDWIYFLDSDDEITPSCIRLMVEQVYIHSNLDFVIGGVKVVGSKRTYPLTCRLYVDSNKEILQGYINAQWYVMAWNHLYRKEYLLQNNLFFEEGIYHEDELHSFQVATTANVMAVVPDETYIYKVRMTGSITGQRKLKHFEDLLLINKRKYKFILQRYCSGDFSISFTYCLDILYWFECVICMNRVLALKDKVQLINRAKNEYSRVEIYKSDLQNLKYKLLYLLQKCPAIIIYEIIKTRMHLLS